MELPPVKPHVTEYQQYWGWCEKCECFTQADLPVGLPKGAFGPRLSALVAMLSGQHHLSKRGVQELLGAVLGVELALGSISKQEGQVKEARQEPMETGADSGAKAKASAFG